MVMIKSSAVDIHLPCPNCGSSNALALYDDGHTYCFSCKTRNYQSKLEGKVLTDDGI